MNQLPNENKRKRKNTPVDFIEGEEWRPIPGSNDKYFASSLGRLRCNFITGYHEEKEVLLSNYNTQIDLTLSKGTKTRKQVAQWVLLAFDYREDYDSLKAVHIDFDTMNNAVNNLRWMTNEQYQAHRKSKPRVPKLKVRHYVNHKNKKQAKNTRFSDGDLAIMRSLYKVDRMTQLQIAQKFKCSQVYVQKVVNNIIRPA